MATFVIVHGGFGGGWEWRDVARALQAEGHEATRPTLSGLGERAHLVPPGVDLETHVEDVVQHLRFEGLFGVTLVAHSYGGMVATGVVDRVPERIAKLVYVDAFAPEDGESLFDLAGPELGGFLRAQDGYPAWYAERGRPHPLACSKQPLRITGGGASVPRAYIKCLRRSDIPLESSLERARARGWPIAELDTHHDAQIGDPPGLAGLLTAA